jgi:hypothetical protein
MPIKGVVKFAIIAGPAIANTRAVVILVLKCEGANSTVSGAQRSGMIIIGSSVPLLRAIDQSVFQRSSLRVRVKKTRQDKSQSMIRKRGHRFSEKDHA